MIKEREKPTKSTSKQQERMHHFQESDEQASVAKDDFKGEVPVDAPGLGRREASRAQAHKGPHCWLQRPRANVALGPV